MNKKQIITAEIGWFSLLHGGTEKQIFFWSIDENENGEIEIRGIVRSEDDPTKFIEISNGLDNHFGYFHREFDKNKMDRILEESYNMYEGKEYIVEY
jgi:hypothetical protein